MHYPLEWRPLNWCDYIFIQTDAIDDQVIQTQRCYKDINICKWACSHSWNPMLLCYFKFEAPRQNLWSCLYTSAFHSRLDFLFPWPLTTVICLENCLFWACIPTVFSNLCGWGLLKSIANSSLNQITAHRKLIGSCSWNPRSCLASDRQCFVWSLLFFLRSYWFSVRISSCYSRCLQQLLIYKLYFKDFGHNSMTNPNQ